MGMMPFWQQKRVEAGPSWTIWERLQGISLQDVPTVFLTCSRHCCLDPPSGSWMKRMPHPLR